MANWRPISLLSPISKVFEFIINRKIRLFLDAELLLSAEQFGFRAKHSTDLLMSLFLQDIYNDFSSDRGVDCVFLDCEKAFDRADHSTIVRRLQLLNVEKSIVALISNYLSGRSQITMVDGVRSEEQCVTSGVPQGSVLGPLLYIILVDSVRDVLRTSMSSLKLFADDIVMYRAVKDDEDEKLLQNDLDGLTRWATAHKLSFNPVKSVHIRFSKKRTSTVPPAYLLASVPVPQKTSVKYLGVYLDSQLRWDVYADNTVSKVYKRSRYMNSLFPQSSQTARLVLFVSLILPLFDYCSAVIHPQLKTLNEAMEKSVNAFLRTVNLGVPLEASSSVKYGMRLTQLELEPLFIRRLKLALLMAYKLIFERIPYGELLFEPFIPFAAASSVAGGTRSAIQRRQHPRPIQMVKKSNSSAEGSFAYVVSKMWIDLPFDESAYFSLPAFQHALNHLDWTRVPFVAKLVSESYCPSWRNVLSH